MGAVFETGADLGLIEDEKLQSREESLGLNTKPIFLATDFATAEMSSFQDGSDATETPKIDDSLFVVFELKRMSGKFLFLYLEIKQH